MMDMFKKLAAKIKSVNSKTNAAHATKPLAEDFLTPKNKFLHKLSRQAVELYEKQTDINNFSKLVLSDPENTSHNNLVKKLFDEGVVDPFVDEKLQELADNRKFLKDLGLL